VSKLSESWRNATITRRGGPRGGFGGVAELERKRQYRASPEVDRRDDDDDRYGMVFDKREAARRRPASRERLLSRSPRRDSQRDRRVSPSPRRGGSHRDRYRDRSYSRSPRREDSRRDNRYRGRDRYDDERRGRDRRDDDRYRDRRRR